jgi:hypothetical protein
MKTVGSFLRRGHALVETSIYDDDDILHSSIAPD